MPLDIRGLDVLNAFPEVAEVFVGKLLPQQARMIRRNDVQTGHLEPQFEQGPGEG